MTWLDGLEPATSRRFEKCIARDASLLPVEDACEEERPSEHDAPRHAPLVRYSAARRGRARVIRQLLLLAPDELARRTDARAALTFARTESINLDNFMNPRFRDSLVHTRALGGAAVSAATA